MIKPVILIFISVLFSVLGQINLKQGMVTVNAQISQSDLTAELKKEPDLNSKARKIFNLLFRAFLNIRIIFGILCYVCGLMLWLVILSKVQLSFAYPLLGMSYILVVFSAALIFKEHVSLERWIGTVVIFIGVVLVARS
jgi:multidrug transporter EmrE-like cation transporter